MSVEPAGLISASNSTASSNRSPSFQSANGEQSNRRSPSTELPAVAVARAVTDRIESTEECKQGDDLCVVAFPVVDSFYPTQTSVGDRVLGLGHSTTTVVEVLDYSYEPPRGQWKDGLCSCFNQIQPICLMAFLCPCVSLSQTAGRLRWGLGYRGLLAIYSLLFFLTWMSGLNISYNSITSMPIYAWVFISWFVTWQVRSSLRLKFQIPGSCLYDGITSLLCNMCSLAQMARHLNNFSKRCEPRECAFTGPLGLP